jgi:hypothetical protein
MALQTDDVVIDSGTVTVTQATGANLHAVIDSGTVTTSPVVSSTATVTQTALTAATNATVLASNVNRKLAVIFIPTATTASPTYLKFGATASATSFTYKFNTSNHTLEIPIWTGQIDMLSTLAQTVTVTELT